MVLVCNSPLSTSSRPAPEQAAAWRQLWQWAGGLGDSRALVQKGPGPGPSGLGSCGSSYHCSRASSLEGSEKRSIFTLRCSWIQRWERIHDSGRLLLTFGDVGALVDGGKQSIPIVSSAAARGFADVHGGRRWHRWRWGTAPSRSSRGRSHGTLGGGHTKPSSALTDKQPRPAKVSTHALAPAQSGGVVLLDVALQVSPDGQVSLDPVNVCLVPVWTRGNKLIRLLQHSSRHSRFNYSDRLFRLFALKRLHVKQKNRK